MFLVIETLTYESSCTSVHLHLSTSSQRRLVLNAVALLEVLLLAQWNVALVASARGQRLREIV